AHAGGGSERSFSGRKGERRLADSSQVERRSEGPPPRERMPIPPTVDGAPARAPPQPKGGPPPQEKGSPGRAGSHTTDRRWKTDPSGRGHRNFGTIPDAGATSRGSFRPPASPWRSRYWSTG